MSRRHWFLPDVPDVLALLRGQVALTVQGIDAFAAWAAGGGDTQAAATVRALEHEADTAKRELLLSLRAAFVTPLDPEDLYALSRGIDWILNHAKDAIGESDAMRSPPDDATATMAAILAESVHHIEAAVTQIANRSGAAAEHAEAAVKAQRRMEKVYRAAMGVLTEHDDLRTLIGRHELYRRCSQMGDTAVDVAERLIYAMIKEN
jgi:uncharacterized protein